MRAPWPSNADAKGVSIGLFLSLLGARDLSLPSVMFATLASARTHRIYFDGRRGTALSR